MGEVLGAPPSLANRALPRLERRGGPARPARQSPAHHI